MPRKHANPTKDDKLKSSFIDMPAGCNSYAILEEHFNPSATYNFLQFTFQQDNDRLSSLEFSNTLFNNLLKRAGIKGVEASRSGGSQGCCAFNDLMRKHLKDPGNFLRHANRMLWFYNTPRIGGHQKLLHDQLYRNKNLPYLKVCPSAVDGMIGKGGAGPGIYIYALLDW
eukprot:15327285-Ditylum_brightwellii.AAC.1